MSDNKKFRNESQDARRHDQQYEVHPTEKPVKKSRTDSHSKPSKKK